MSRVRLLLVSMLGVVALTAIASATASAEPTAKCTPSGTGKVEFCVQNKAGELLVLGLPALETIEILSSKTTGTASSLVVSDGLEISCTAAANTGIVDGSPTENTSLGSVVVTFTGCTVPAPAHCAVENPTTKKTGEIVTSSLNGVVSATEKGDIVFKPASGAFTTFNIISSGGTCALAHAGTKVNGSVLGTLSEAETDLETHKLSFAKATGLLLVLGEEELASEFTLTEDVIADRPSTWSSTVWAEHPAYGVFFTSAIS